MFALLTEFLPESQQVALLATAIERRGKGLKAPPPFLELPIETIIEAAIAKVMGYKNSYAEARLAHLGVSMPTSIWCDRAAEFAIFLRGMAIDIVAFEAALLEKCNGLVSQDELAIQTGGLKLGYWLLFAKMEQTVTLSEDKLVELGEHLKCFVRGKSQWQESTFSFAMELENYIHAKTSPKGRGSKKRPVCAMTGLPASDSTAAGSPYKVQCYSNRRSLGSPALVSYLTPEWQKELALRKALWGNDERHEKVWIYSDQLIDRADLHLPMALMPPFWAIRKACQIVAVNGGRALVSPSVLPHEIEQNYEIEALPDWLEQLGCSSSGSQKDAEHILEVINVLLRLHNAKPLGTLDRSLKKHAYSALDPLYIPHVLPCKTEADIRGISVALRSLGYHFG